jgi:hypothetical protein
MFNADEEELNANTNTRDNASNVRPAIAHSQTSRIGGSFMEQRRASFLAERNMATSKLPVLDEVRKAVDAYMGIVADFMPNENDSIDTLKFWQNCSPVSVI